MLMFSMTPVIVFAVGIHLAVALLAAAFIKKAWAVAIGLLASLILGLEFLPFGILFGIPALAALGIVLYLRSHATEDSDGRLADKDAWVCGGAGFILLLILVIWYSS